MLSPEIHQQRVEHIAPILAFYLKINQKHHVENELSIVMYDPSTKIIHYQNKTDPQEQLKAKLKASQWQVVNNTLSREKINYFLESVGPALTRHLPRNNLSR